MRRNMTRPGHSTALATRVELARLSGRNLASLEAEMQAPASAEEAVRLTAVRHSVPVAALLRANALTGDGCGRKGHA